MEEIFEHDWFKDIDIEEIKNRGIDPPFMPRIKSKYDTKYYKA